MRHGYRTEHKVWLHTTLYFETISILLLHAVVSEAKTMAFSISRMQFYRSFNAMMTQIPVRGKRTKAGRKSAIESSESNIEQGLDMNVYNSGMEKVLDSLQKGLARLRSSGATPDILDSVTVEAYGSKAPLKDVAHVSVRDGKNLSVNVFDPSVASAVEKSIRGAGLNLNPVSDGNNKIRVPIPTPTRETKEAMRKIALKEAETARIAARLLRRDAMDEIKKMKSDLPQDEVKRMEKDMQQLTDKYVRDIDHLVKEKVKSLEAR